MSKYYYLISGLPDITLDDSKQVYSVLDFKNEVMPMLSEGDRKLFSYFFLKFDNQNLLSFLQNPESTWDERGNIPQEDIVLLYNTLKENELPKKNVLIPAYFADFIKSYLLSAEKNETSQITWDDKLSSMYYAYATRVKNDFMAAWYELNLNIGNVLTAINCRKYNLDKGEYLIGKNEITEMLRSSNARDFGLGDTLEYIPELLRITEETDLLMREKKIDLLKWNWIEEQIFFKTFDYESVFSYLLRIEMIERWAILDKTAGEKAFREMVKVMKRESADVLDEFKRNNIK